MKYLVFGLGNPGPKYELTRHNIGFLVLDRLQEKINAPDFVPDRHAEVSEGKFKGRTIRLIKPSTYMNLSGKAVNYWMQEEKVPVERILVITDDVALDFGRLKLKGKGSSGGHNGLQNIQDTLGTPAYPRLRFGVGKDFPKGAQVDYVLGNFSPDQLKELPERMDKAVEGVLSLTTIGMERTMNFVNTK